MHSGTELQTINGFRIIDCTECGFIHTDPLPGPEELERVYSDEYYTEEKPEYIDNLREDLGWWTTVYDSRYAFLEGELPPERRSIVDVGCGPGYFLKRGEERGWKGVGIEPSRLAAEHASTLGLEVVNAFMDGKTAQRLGRSFDAAHLSEVLEHVASPAEVLSLTRGLLKDGGVVCCVVPNDFSPVQKVLSDRLSYEPYWLAPPHHLNYFNFKSLKRLLERTGFTVIHETAMFPMDFFLLMGEDYVGDDETGRRCHGMRKRLDMMMEAAELKGFKEELYSLMARHGIGRETVVYARKG